MSGKLQVILTGLLVAGVVATTAADEKPDEAAKLDALLVKAQKICPVSGQPLDSMGGPVKADVGGATMFLCCRGCLGKKIPPEHWATVTRNMIRAQGNCPVLGKPLPQNAASVVVDKRKVFVCCPPCNGKIKADPQRYLAAVDRLLEQHLKAPDDGAATPHQ
ncbi:MAG: hypothetical protein KDA90_21595 [Planctomycetaceae bacterium]|nr:hypothetical protein [Planctomycetaceae bacterium]